MDITDKKILKILSENANTTATEISTMVNLSVPRFIDKSLKIWYSFFVIRKRGHYDVGSFRYRYRKHKYKCGGL
ncbi:MAG: AsnC family protein [Clostridia bacterium]|nr:AsnC family protein [Clostridia bacterium]